MWSLTLADFAWWMWTAGLEYKKTAAVLTIYQIYPTHCGKPAQLLCGSKDFRPEKYEEESLYNNTPELMSSFPAGY